MSDYSERNIYFFDINEVLIIIICYHIYKPMKKSYNEISSLEFFMLYNNIIYQQNINQ